MSSNNNQLGNGDECAAGSVWRKSSYSLSNGQCVEVAQLADGRIGVRDSKAADGPVLRFEAGVWAAFLADLRAPKQPYSRSLAWLRAICGLAQTDIHELANA
jgi:hypothetical protein